MISILRCECDTRAPTCLYKFNCLDESQCKTIIYCEKPQLVCIECAKYDEALKDMMKKFEEQELEQKITVDNYDENGICKIKRTFTRKKETKPRQPKLNEDERDERFRQQDIDKELRKEQKIKEQNQIIKNENKKIREDKKKLLEDYKNKPIPKDLKVKQREARKCKGCNNDYKCFPDDFEDVMRYFKLIVPFNFTNICNGCFKSKLEKIQKNRDKIIDKNTYDCPCGKSWFIPYKQKSKNWKNEIEKHKCSINHKLYEEDMDTFCDLKDYLGFNLYIKTKKELIEFIKNRNISIKITVDDTREIILKKLINMFKVNKSFKQSEYDFWNDLSRDELCVLIKECGLKIKYYKNLSKDELIKKIIDY